VSEHRVATVTQLQAEGILLVEDGNHGEYRPRPQEFVPHGVAFIRAADMHAGRVDFDGASHIGDVARRRITKGIGAPGDVLLSHKGTVGKVAMVPDDAPSFVCSPQTTFWRALRPDVLDPRYLYAYLRSQAFHTQLDARAGETDMAPYVSLTSQRGLAVVVPPIEDQRRIAGILGALDEKIELNRRMGETLEAMARALFRSWFVTFEPVRAKSEGRSPHLPPYLVSSFPDRFTASELGEIPEGWGVQRVADLATLDKGISYKGEFLGKNGMPMISLGCFVGQGRFAEAGVKHYSGEFKDRHVIRSRDLVIANTDLTQKRDVLGSPALVPPRVGAGRFLFTHHVYAARFLDGKELWKLFLYYALLQGDFRDRAIGYATGTTVLGLPRDAILGLTLVAPPERLVTAFSTAASVIHERRWKAAEEGASLAGLRDALLPRLLSGDSRSAMRSRRSE
jgi:type I restriction enzyme S subunit